MVSASRPIRQRRRGVGHLFALSTALVAGLATLATGCAQSQAEGAPALSLVTAGRQHLEIVVEAAGELEPIKTVEVMSKASGEVTQVLVDTGDKVENGQLLARIDPRDVQNDFDQAQADYEVARQRMEISRAQLDRSQRLLDAGVITEEEHESSDLDFANSQSTLVRAQTTLDLARLRLADVTITSPLAGTVLVKNVEEGQVISSPSGNVSGGTVLLTVADLSVMQVRTLVNESDVGRIEPGMLAKVQVDAFQDQSFEGNVEKIEPQAVVEQNVVNFPVIVSLDNGAGILKPGMSANVTVTLAERPDALTLPNNAIVSFDEMAAAASVLGVPDDRLQMDPSAFQELRRQLTGAPAAAVAREEGAEGAPAGSAGAPGADLQALRQQVESGQLSPEEIQARIQAARGAGGGNLGRSGGGGRGGNGGGAFARNGGGRSGGGGGSALDGTNGVVFVMDADGTLSPRAVLVGVTDWSNSEILAGLEEGEQVALIGVAGLQEETGRGMGFGGRGGVRIPFF